jgi:hypothetical protein
MAIGPAVFDRDILAVGVANFLQSCAERALKGRVRLVFPDIEESGHGLGRLLRARRQRIKCRST